jgi:fumarate hydratase class II
MTDDPKNVHPGIAKRAHAEGVSLHEAALSSGSVTTAQYDAWVHPAEMTHPRDVP